MHHYGIVPVWGAAAAIKRSTTLLIIWYVRNLQKIVFFSIVCYILSESFLREENLLGGKPEGKGPGTIVNEGMLGYSLCLYNMGGAA
jgi:hypothetical protein